MLARRVKVPRACAWLSVHSSHLPYCSSPRTGFDALVAELDGKSGSFTVRELDVKRSDIAFDALPLANGAWLVAGAADWTQNPGGASVSEASQAFLRGLAEDGSSTPIAIASGPRHNEARTLLAFGADRYLIGGMTDGPGTHSGDVDASLVRASGFLREVRTSRE